MFQIAIIIFCCVIVIASASYPEKTQNIKTIEENKAEELEGDLDTAEQHFYHYRYHYNTWNFRRPLFIPPPIFPVL